MQKKGGITLSFNAIDLVMVAVVILFLGLFFFRNIASKTGYSFNERTAMEPDPSTPTSSEPITLSRGRLRIPPGGEDSLKIGIFNPMNEEWALRDYLYLDPENPCKSDHICYQSPTCINDSDCTEPSPECGPDGRCLITFDPDICRIGADADCAPTEGVRLSVTCSENLDLFVQTNLKAIPIGRHETFIAALRIDKKAHSGKYLCQISVGNRAKGYTKDFIIDVD